MNRPIKFRAWDKKNNVMIPNCGLSFSDCGWSVELPRPMMNPNNEPVTYPLDFFELLQFTGLTDKNGVEIFEGDIVKCWNWGNSPDDLLCISVVQWSDDDKGWWLNPDPTDGDRYDLFRNVETIGNIYENPELLEGGE